MTSEEERYREHMSSGFRTCSSVVRSDSTGGQSLIDRGFQTIGEVMVVSLGVRE